MPDQREDAGAFRLPWLGMAATILLCAGLLVLFRQEVVGFIAQLTPHRADGNAALEITPAGDALQIAFPPGARRGVLSIQDGEALHRFNLSAGDLAMGRFQYRAASTNVTVRLDADGRTESARVLRQPEVETATAAAASTPAPSAPALPPVLPAPAGQPETGTADRAATPSAPDQSVRKLPAPFPKALRSIHGILHVDVQVEIAADGSVQSAAVSGPATSPYFRRISLEAAQASRFDPSAGGASRTLQYEYTREGVQVSEAAAK